MSAFHRRWRYLALALSWVLAFWFAVPRSVQAQWIGAGDTIPAGQVIENDVLLTGTNIVVDGAVHGDSVAVG